MAPKTKGPVKPEVKKGDEDRQLRLAIATAILCFGRKTDDLDPKILTALTPKEALSYADFLIAG